MSVKLLTPYKLAKNRLKLRVKALKEILPTNWKVLYLYEYPEDVGQEDFLGRVMAGKSLHEATIEKLEKLAQKLKDKKLISEQKNP